jgi:hypothetical protein
MPKVKRAGTQKPIARVKGKVSASIYKGRFDMAEHVKYLDINALNRAAKAVVEIGSVSAAGISVPLLAEVHKGVVLKIRPTHCASCKPKGRKSSKGTQFEKVAKAALEKVRDLGLPSVKLPMPIARLRGGGGLFNWTITIIDDGVEICIVIEVDDGKVCFFCTKTPSFCIN